MSKVLTPMWEVFINDKKLVEEKKYITDIELDESVNGSDTCTISIADEHAEFISDNFFVDDAKVRVEIIWMEGILEVFEGFVSAIDIVFPSDGVITMDLFCLDGSHRMNKEEKSRSFGTVTRASVVEKIAKEYGFKFVLDSDYKGKATEISQSNQTDIEFCESLAEDEDSGGYWRAKLIGDTMYYTKYGILTTPVAKLNYRSDSHDIHQFTPKVTNESVKEEEKAEAAAGGGGTGGGVPKKYNPTWKVVFPDGSVKYYKTLKSAQDALTAAMNKAGWSPIKIDFSKPQELRGIKPKVSLTLSAPNLFPNLEMLKIQNVLSLKPGSLLPAGPTMFTRTEDKKWTSGSEQITLLGPTITQPRNVGLEMR